MSILHFRSTERRRTARIAVRVDVVIEGKGPDRELFKLPTRTTSLSAHGGVFELHAEGLLQPGQVVEMTNEFNMRKATVRILAVRRGREGEMSASFEFVREGAGFWSVAFPPAGARPLRKFRAKVEPTGEN